MSGKVSCRAVRPLFRYLHERGIPLSRLLADFPVSSQELFEPENWLAEALFADLLERAASLANDPDLTAHVGATAGEPCAWGLLSPQALLAGDPVALLQQAPDFLSFLQPDGQVRVGECRPGRVVVECLPPAGQRSYHICTYTRHLLGAIPRLWQVDRVQVRELRCAVPLAQVRLPSGNRCAVDGEGTVWEISPPDRPAARLLLGHRREDGTFLLDGTLYGADRCAYEVTWSAPPVGVRRIIGRLSPFRLLVGEIRRQRRMLQELREQIRQVNLTTEARILERTEELRVKARRMALVEQASRRFAAILDTESLCVEAARTLREEFGYYSVALYLLEGDEWVLRSLSSGDITVQQRPSQRFYAEPDMREHLLRAGRPFAQEDLQTQPHPLGLPALGKGRSSLTAPLVASGRLLGVLDLQRPLREPFDDHDAVVLHTLATQAAVSLERSRLYQEEQRARQRADAMAVLARVVTTSLEMDRILPLALDQLGRLLPYDAAAVLLLEDTGWNVAASSGFPPQAAPALGALLDPDRPGLLARTLQQGEAGIFAAPPRPAEGLPAGLAHLSSWLAAPLTSRQVVMGAFVLAARRPQAYRPDDLRTAQELADQVATAIENARLYAALRHDRDHLETLYEIARELNTDLEIEEVLRHILDLARASVGATAGSIILLDASGRPSHSIILYPGHDTETVIGEVLTRGAAGWVVREQQPLLIQDTRSDSRWISLPADPWATRSAILVPLIGQDRVFGVLTVVHPQAGRFDPDDLDLLVSIAGQASSVVQRAHLFTAIRDERARLRAVIEGTADAVIVLDEAGQVLHLNRSAADLLGPDSPLGSDPDRLRESPALQKLLRSEGAGGAPASAGGERKRLEIPFSDGRTFYATLTPIPAVGTVITMQDITYLKELDRLKSDFVANVSHDLRTPLGAVQGFAEMLELAGPLNEDQTLFVQRILSSVESMTALVDNLLDLAKIEAGVEMEMAPCQVAAVVSESVDQLAGLAARKPVTLQVQIPDDLPLVWGNGRRLGQVVNNLLDNAIKYAPANGVVGLRVYVEGNEVRVDVSDNGPGIPAADLPHIFEKFYRARRLHRAAQGTGLGLSIARSIILAHQGRIWAESKEGEGATFSFGLPLWNP